MRPLLRVVCVVLGTALSFAQEPAFDVASIRPTPATVTKPDDIQTMPNGRVLANNTTAKLKLESRRMTVPVIDSVDRPSDN